MVSRQDSHRKLPSVPCHPENPTHVQLTHSTLLSRYHPDAIVSLRSIPGSSLPPALVQVAHLLQEVGYKVSIEQGTPAGDADNTILMEPDEVLLRPLLLEDLRRMRQTQQRNSLAHGKRAPSNGNNSVRLSGDVTRRIILEAPLYEITTLTPVHIVLQDVCVLCQEVATHLRPR